MLTIEGKNNDSEFVIIRLIHGMSVKFELHEKTLPSTPGIVLPKCRTAARVHGFFRYVYECSLPSDTRNVQRFLGSKA